MRRVRSSLVLLLVLSGPAAAVDAWVPNQGTDDLTVFDTADPSIRITLPLGNQPHEGVATLDARRMFFSNRQDGNLSVYDVASRTEIDVDRDPTNGLTRLTVGTAPHGLALTPDNRYLFVANDGSNDVTVVDVNALSVVATVSGVGAAPHMIAISPDGTEAWTGNVGGGDVSILDVERAVAGEPALICATPGGVGSTCRIATGSGTEGLAFARDGRTVYAANGGANTVSVIDVGTRAVVATLPVPGGPRRVHLRPDGRRAYVSQLFGTELRVIDTTTHRLVPAETLVGLNQVLGLEFSADGSRLYAANFFDATVTIVDTADPTQRSTVPTGSNPDSVVLPPERVFDVGFTGSTLRWLPNVLATGYDVYRGDLADLPDYGACVTAEDPDPTDAAFEDLAPLPGRGFFYHVTLQAGPTGYASDGTPRHPGTPCPDQRGTNRPERR